MASEESVHFPRWKCDWCSNEIPRGTDALHHVGLDQLVVWQT